MVWKKEDCTPYTVKKGEDLRSIAEQPAHDIWDWLTLWEVQKALGHPNALFLENPDRLLEGDVIQIPKKHTEQCKELLRKRAQNADAYFGGLAYLPPWGTVSFTILDDDDETFYEAGLPFEFRAASGEVVEFYDRSDKTFKKAGKLNAHGGLEVDLPRSRYFLYVDGIRVADVRPEDFDARRKALCLPGDWLPAHRELVRERGLKAAYPGQVGALDAFSLAFPDGLVGEKDTDAGG